MEAAAAPINPPTTAAPMAGLRGGEGATITVGGDTTTGGQGGGGGG